MRVSVIIPCYNAKDFIADALDSVYNQTYKDLEVICVDNNSTDGTWNYLNSLKQRYRDLKLIQEFKAGANAARNTGLRIAKGDWVQFLDADDILMKTKLEHQVNIAKRVSENTAFIAGAWKSNSKSNERLNLLPEKKRFIAPFFNESGNTCSNLWRRKDIVNIGYWNEDIYSSQETELMLRLILGGKDFEIDNLPLTIVNELEVGRISTKPKKETLRQYLSVRLNFLNKIDSTKFELKSIDYAKCSDFMMNTVINLSKYDLSEAVFYFKKITENGWRSSGKYGITFLKRLIIKTIGFRLFCKIINR